MIGRYRPMDSWTYEEKFGLVGLPPSRSRIAGIGLQRQHPRRVSSGGSQAGGCPNNYDHLNHNLYNLHIHHFDNDHGSCSFAVRNLGSSRNRIDLGASDICRT